MVAAEVMEHVLNKHHKNGKDFRDRIVQEGHDILVQSPQKLHSLDA